jgi:VWFA-related protein
VRALPAAAVCLAVAQLLAVPRAQQPDASQRPVFRGRAEAVRVDALVTDNNRPVRGLQADDFELLDNGVRQQVDAVSFDNIPLDVVLALDTSGSVAGERLEQLRSAAGGLVGHLRSGDRAALVTFNEVVLQASALTPDLDTVRAALKDALASGVTSLRDGIFTGLTIGDAGGGRSLLIVFSDGLDTSSWLPGKDILDIARRANVVAYGITTARTGKAPFLQELCSVTGGSLFQAEWSATLSQAFLDVLDEFRHRYVLTYSPRGVEAGGFHRLTVRVKGRNVRIKARPGYLSVFR